LWKAHPQFIFYSILCIPPRAFYKFYVLKIALGPRYLWKASVAKQYSEGIEMEGKKAGKNKCGGLN
jgi:hypothetical protein